MQTYEIEITQTQKATIRVQAHDNVHAQSLTINLIEANAIDFEDLDTSILSIKEV